VPRFEVTIKSVIVGNSELEHGDPPMGVATGKFLPNLEYAKFQAAIIFARDKSQSHLSLGIRVCGGQELSAMGGVRIADYSAELGDDALEVYVLGITSPDYAELFPNHVAAYEAQFPRKS